MKISIRVKFTAVFALVLGAAIALCILFNSLYLEEYYIKEKVSAMLSACEELEAVLLSAPEDIGEARDGAASSNSSAMLGDPSIGDPDDSQPHSGRRNDSSEENTDADPRIINLFYKLKDNSNITAMVIHGGVVYTAEGVDRTWISRVLSERQSIYGAGSGGGRSTVISETEEYSIIKYYDNVTGTYYLEAWGSLEEGSIFFMRTPLASISESVGISNNFFLYIGLAVAVAGVIVMYAVMGLVTGPIIKLQTISKRMSEMDFEAKYTGSAHDEIGELGRHLNEMSEKLEEGVARLKAANLELTRDIEEKEQLEAARSEFIGNVSHELKTPLAVIQGYAEGLQEGVAEDPESAAYYCEVIIDEAQKMNRMVKKLLTLNELEQGREKLDLTRFDLTALTSGVCQAYGILAKNKGATIIFTRRDSAFTWGDEYKIEEVISNYISNAINHISGRMEIDVRIIEKEGTVRLEVENSGSHIPEEDIEKVWDKFYKVDKAHTRSYGGNGIGLSIVKAIIDLHGGRCGAQNTDAGVMFWFELSGNTQGKTAPETV
ncbi:MAG: HAMP domain-containing protein [Lachnospiraceae bacterium]|nr:HAMP domain-containing protein [Lachnospiraceae bacterium]